MAEVKPCDREAATKAGEEALRNVADLTDYDHDAMIRHFAAYREAAIAPLVEEVALWKREAADRSQGMVDLNLDRAAMGVTIMQLREELEWYADTFCEYGTYETGCGKYDGDVCSGCRARAALQSLGENGK